MDVVSPPSRKTQAGTRLRRFTLTLNNYSLDEYHDFVANLNALCSWGVLGKEVGAEGTHHLQGAGVLKKQESFSTLKKAFPRAHLESMKGSPQQNLDYCTKEDRDAYQFGTIPGQGKRTDLHEVADLVDGGANLREIADAHPTSVVKFYKGIMVLRSIKAGRRDPNKPPRVYWLFGPTGSGKTRAAFSYGCSTYSADETLILPDCTLQWFDTYDGQKCVIFDDFRSKGVTFSFLLRILDRYPCSVPIKGAFVNWNPECIFITTPLGVDETFAVRAEKIPEDIRQLKRRLTAIIEFPLTGIIGLQQAMDAADYHIRDGQPPPLYVPRLGAQPGGGSLELPMDVEPRSPLTRQDACVTQCKACCNCVTSVNRKGFCKDCQ